MERLRSYSSGVDTVEGQGQVANLNLAAGTCTIGVLTVASSGASQPPSGQRAWPTV